MKWASKFNLFAMGLAVATASQSISAMPVLRTSGPDSGLNPTGVMPAWQGGESIEPFQAAPQAQQDGKVLELKAAQDAIATLIGLPLLQIDGFEAIEPIAAKPAADIDALVASLLGNDGVDTDAALAELAEADAGMGLEDTVNLLGSQGAGGGGGGAFYGGGNVRMGGAPLYATGHASHKTTQGGGSGGGGGTVTPNVIVPTIISTDGEAISGGGSTVPLPSGAWAGLLLLGSLGGAMKLRTNREQLA